MWLSKKKYKEITDLRTEVEYITTMLHQIKHSINEIKPGSRKPPVKNS